jgi:CHAT domain-containing protein
LRQLIVNLIVNFFKLTTIKWEFSLTDAQGDDQAALGIAGIALKSGARSTLGTLWSVSDQSTALLIEQIYRQIAIAPQNKAQILRKAQLTLINSEQFNYP